MARQIIVLYTSEKYARKQSSTNVPDFNLIAGILYIGIYLESPKSKHAKKNKTITP